MYREQQTNIIVCTQQLLSYLYRWYIVHYFCLDVEVGIVGEVVVVVGACSSPANIGREPPI